MAKKSILLAEDHALTRKNIALILDLEGFEVFCATDGAEALTLFADRKPDLVLTDIGMPEVDGLGVLSAVKQVAPQTPVIIITAAATPDNEHTAHQLGADDFLIKPLDFDDLLARIQRALKS